MHAVTGRDAQIAGQSRLANSTTTWREARNVLRNRELKIKPLDVWDFWKCKRKGRNPYTTKLTPTSIGLSLSSQRNGSQESSHPCTRPRVAAETDDRVFQQRCRPIDPICFSALDPIVRYESARGLKYGLAIRRTRPHSSFSVFHWEFEQKCRPFADIISRVMWTHKDPSGYASLPSQATPGQDISCTMLLPFP